MLVSPILNKLPKSCHHVLKTDIAVSVTVTALCPSLTVDNMADLSILANMYVETVRVEILGNHRTRLDDACWLWELGLAEGLRKKERVSFTCPQNTHLGERVVLQSPKCDQRASCRTTCSSTPPS